VFVFFSFSQIIFVNYIDKYADVLYLPFRFARKYKWKSFEKKGHREIV